MGHYADMLLGKDKIAELRAIARRHKLAAGSQTVPNSVVEIAAAQGQSPPADPPAAAALPAPNTRNYPSRRPRGRPLG